MYNIENKNFYKYENKFKKNELLSVKTINFLVFVINIICYGNLNVYKPTIIIINLVKVLLSKL